MGTGAPAKKAFMIFPFSAGVFVQ